MQPHRQITDVTSIGDRLREARLEAGLTQARLAKKAKVSQSTIGNFEAGRGQIPRELLSIAAAVNVRPEWLKEGKLPKRPLNTAPLLTESSINLPRTPMKWGDLKMEGLPEVFEVTLEDDAMAPDFPAGSVIQFDARAAPAFGNRVLIRDGRGAFHFRTYVQTRADAWEGVPLNSAFVAIQPVRDEARVVAVKAGHWVKGP